MKTNNETMKNVMKHSKITERKRGKMFNKVISRSKKGTEKIWDKISK